MLSKLTATIAGVIMAFSVVGATSINTVSAVEVPGNNGTLKVHELGTASGTESNDPKVCKFNFEAFGFDEFQDGYIMIEPQGGSEPVGEAVGPVNVGPANESGYFESVYFNNGGTVVKDGTYKATLYGKDLPSDEETLADEKAKSKVFKVDCEPVVVPGVPDSAVSLVCPTNKYTLTVSNTGTTELSVQINGVDRKIAVGGAAITADFNVGDVLTVKIDGTPVTVEGKVLNNFKLVTCQGMGSTVTTNNTTNTTTNVVASTGFGAGAATDVTSLPVTSGSSAQAAGVIMTLGTILAAAGAYLTRSRSGLSI